MGSVVREFKCNEHLTPTTQIAFVAGFLLLASTWIVCEISAASCFTPEYDYIAFAISDLGVPYPVEHGNGEPTFESPLASVMNFGFVSTGWLYGLINLALLWKTRNYEHRYVTAKFLRAFRCLCSLIVIIGLTLVGLVHGGPRELQNGVQELHNSGAFFAMLFSHFNSICAGAIKHQTVRIFHHNVYRYGSILMGVLGLVNLNMYVRQPPGLLGLFERLTVYLVLLWVLWNALWLAFGTETNESCAIDATETEPLLA